jgi:hypothetical protein
MLVQLEGRRPAAVTAQTGRACLHGVIYLFLIYTSYISFNTNIFITACNLIVLLFNLLNTSSGYVIIFADGVDSSDSVTTLTNMSSLSSSDYSPRRRLVKYRRSEPSSSAGRAYTVSSL